MQNLFLDFAIGGCLVDKIVVYITLNKLRNFYEEFSSFEELCEQISLLIFIDTRGSEWAHVQLWNQKSLI